MPPLPSADDHGFRAEVVRLRADERRRYFPLRLHVGALDGFRPSLEVPWPVPQEYDDGLRFDLATALVEQLLGADCVGLTWGWLTRPGVPELHDVDLPWLSATTRAFAALEVEPAGFRVVTRIGWLDPATGDSRVWRRLRTKKRP
jgi:hypothetical protein